jgi:hypothetical protein
MSKKEEMEKTKDKTWERGPAFCRI